MLELFLNTGRGLWVTRRRKSAIFEGFRGTLRVKMPEKTRRSTEPRRFWPACPRLPDDHHTQLVAASSMRKFFVYAGFVVRKGRPKPLLALSDLRNGIRHRAARHRWRSPPRAKERRLRYEQFWRPQATVRGEAGGDRRTAFWPLGEAQNWRQALPTHEGQSRPPRREREWVRARLAGNTGPLSLFPINHAIFAC